MRQLFRSINWDVAGTWLGLIGSGVLFWYIIIRWIIS